MFGSGVTLNSVISGLESEMDIAIPIEKERYIEWINSLEQLLYREVIKEQAECVIEIPEGAVLDLSRMRLPDDRDSLYFEDIYAVFADEKQLIKTSLASGKIFPDCFFKDENKMGYSLTGNPSDFRIIYTVRPKPKVTGEEIIMLPVEFVELAKAKLRGEAYKLANEDALAAKWLNDYNVLLETFKAWISGKAPEFGL